ncbi:MAG: cardiolipin synthase [Clostridiales bacterium]|jgi:cardiolipin synthase|nr:cardiolipin synthase [Clostridiales bacterium]
MPSNIEFPELFTYLTAIIYAANIIIGFFAVFFDRRSPSVTWAWLMVIALIPYVGFLIYLMFGFESRKHAAFMKKSKQDEQIIKDASAFWKHKPLDQAPTSLRDDDLVKLIHTLGGHGLTTNNALVIYHEGNTKYEQLLKDIKNAKVFIHMQYYIMKNGELGRAVLTALAEKAREGVEVKVSVDAMGSLPLTKRFFKPLINAGGEVIMFRSPILVRLNYHNHRKICIIDGIIGYTGGLNIGDEYLGKAKRFGFWRDTHIRITGDAVKDLEIRFICDWNCCAKKKITDFQTHLPSLNVKRDGIPIQIVSSGPDTRWPSILYSYNKMVTEANKSIYIETPYFIPDDNLLGSLRVAALSGIDVRIVIPANPDHVLVYWASLSYLGDLLKAGARCYKYENGFIHSKLMIQDGMVSSVGTANMDIRSLKLNFEVNAVIYDADAAAALEVQFFRDLEKCTEITTEWYLQRSPLIKVKESIGRLLSPLL